MQRKQFTTTIREDYLKKIKILAIEEDKRVNDILEEAIEKLINQLERKVEENWPNLYGILLLTGLILYYL